MTKNLTLRDEMMDMLIPYRHKITYLEFDIAEREIGRIIKTRHRRRRSRNKCKDIFANYLYSNGLYKDLSPTLDEVYSDEVSRDIR